MKRTAAIFAILAGPALAEAHDPAFRANFTLGLGAQSAPTYFGSDETTIGPTGSFGFGSLNIGSLSFGGGDPNGIGFKGGFRYIGERSGDDYAELTGLDDVDAALELGGGLTFTDTANGTTDNWGSYSFAEVRYGVVGHETWVAEIGSDLVYAPTRDLTLTLGPRLFGGTDDYSATYFGITQSEAESSTFPAYNAGGGILSRGLEASATYNVTDIWGITGTVTYEEFLNDAADSPIVQQGSSDQISASILLTRSFSF